MTVGMICWSEGIEEGELSFAFRPLWQLDEPAKAALALSRAQATQVYAGLKLWPDAVVARLAEAQLVADGMYPNAAAVFAEGRATRTGHVTADAFPVRPGFDPAQPRDPDGRWTAGGGSTAAPPIVPVSQPIGEDPDPTPEEEQEELEEKTRRREDPLKFFRQGIGPDGIVRIPVRPGGGGVPTVKLAPTGGAEVPATPSAAEPSADPDQISSPKSPKLQTTTPRAQKLNAPAIPAARPSGLGSAGPQPDDVTRGQLFSAAWEELKTIDPKNRALEVSRVPGALPTGAELESVKGALRKAKIAAWRELDSRLERVSPSAPPRIPSRSALEGYYWNPKSPGPFADALYPEIEAGPEGFAIDIKPPEKVKRPEEGDLEAIKSPKAFNRGTDYEAKIFQKFDLNKPDGSWSDRKLKPDATTPDAAVEVKFTDDFRRSMYHPAKRSRFADKEVSESIEQAMKYADGDPPRKLVFYTNEWGLAEYYTRAFRGVGLSSFRFIIVPAIRRSENGKFE